LQPSGSSWQLSPSPSPPESFELLELLELLELSLSPVSRPVLPPVPVVPVSPVLAVPVLGAVVHVGDRLGGGRGVAGARGRLRRGGVRGRAGAGIGDAAGGLYAGGVAALVAAGEGRQAETVRPVTGAETTGACPVVARRPGGCRVARGALW
jgi:hypothetical protein